MVLHATVTIGYDTPWRQVHALLTLAVRSVAIQIAQLTHEGALPDAGSTHDGDAHGGAVSATGI